MDRILDNLILASARYGRTVWTATGAFFIGHGLFLSDSPRVIIVGALCILLALAWPGFFRSEP